MADFLTAYKTVKQNEGGYRNVSWDNGGETYKGVARRYNPQWPGWSIIDQYKKNGPIKTGTVFNNPTLDKMVLDLFKSQYWTPNNFDKLNNQSIANLCLDSVINHGYAERKIINPAAKEIDPKVLLSDTVRTEAINAINSQPQRAYQLIASKRVAYVQSLASQLGPDFAGVLDRAKRFLNAFVAGGGGFLILAGIFIFILYINSNK